ncbi:hypothetical protein SADUNF_Sadunf09G0115000 [Salix dunnii]|uniref:Uncharacterized protein n=1 Tax=Salix dunnii TaxID=1413687 RepID=A0A835JU37_9ROSI|nr:hypothetical protein SADUNF_Sadunf09G0115000 [Salix dunnii]
MSFMLSCLPLHSYQFRVVNSTLAEVDLSELAKSNSIPLEHKHYRVHACSAQQGNNAILINGDIEEKSSANGKVIGISSRVGHRKKQRKWEGDWHFKQGGAEMRSVLSFKNHGCDRWVNQAIESFRSVISSALVRSKSTPSQFSTTWNVRTLT